MIDDELLRYSRQIMLPQMDIAGQQALIDAKVLVVGLGGLGSPVAMYLAAAGVGSLVLVDDDVVELSNLQRQIAHGTDTLGLHKVDSAKLTLLRLNPGIEVTSVHERLEGAGVDALVSQCDIVVDACDNFQTRFAVNASCVKFGKPLVSGAAIRMEGQIIVFNPVNASSPCYRCLYSDDVGEDLNCATNGVMAPLVGIIGAMQAMETIKLLTKIGQPLEGRLLLLDATTMEWREVKLPKDPECPVCGSL
ncbi:MAG: molybdopterin/thiamine biosynthesis adenylyltransferase [Pseudohongiellaceae bacterium]|jgi:molybdopterin/thiamine biosynthesis adenylyltransferase